MQDPPRSISDDLPKAPGMKIIRASEESAWRDGYRFLAEAEKVYKTERAKGYAEGLAQAEQDASNLVLETAAKIDRYMASLEKQIAQLSFNIVRRVLADFDDAELVARAACNALGDFRDAKAVRIKVHPSAEARLRLMLMGDARSGADRSPAVTIETDAELDEERCILSTEFAIIEATIDSQLAAIARAMGLEHVKAAG
jgi:type III secretion protein L